jgi:heme exporter protein C
MAGVIVASFLAPVPQPANGEASRIVYYHVPMAWLAAVAYTVNMIYAIRYLRRREGYDDWRSSWSAQLGLVFAILATISGSVFAKVTWGAYWNWSEPRMLSIFILLLIYGAYFSLRTAVADPERRATLSGVYSLFAFPTMVFLIFVFPRIVPQSLHPSDTVVNEEWASNLGSVVMGIFFVSLFCFTAIYFWLFSLGNRLHRLRARQEMEIGL